MKGMDVYDCWAQGLGVAIYGCFGKLRLRFSLSHSLYCIVIVHVMVQTEKAY